VRLTARGWCTLLCPVLPLLIAAVVEQRWLVVIAAGALLVPAYSIVSTAVPRKRRLHSFDFGQDDVFAPGPQNVTWRIRSNRVLADRRSCVASISSQSEWRIGVPVSLGKDEHTATTQLHDVSRGLLTVGPVTERHTDYFGMAYRDRVANTTSSTLILPQVVEIHLPRWFAGEPQHSTALTQGHEELSHLREYAPGDDHRRIHWPSTAKHGTLLFRVEQDPSEPVLAVILDDSLQGLHLDTATTVAASIATAAATSRVSCALLTPSGSIDHEVIERQLYETYEELALLQTTESDEDIVMRTVAKVSQRCAVVLITTPSRATALAGHASLTVSVGTGPVVHLDDVMHVSSVQDFQAKWAEFAGPV